MPPPARTAPDPAARMSRRIARRTRSQAGAAQQKIVQCVLRIASSG
ncbi:hypothetical protein BSIN_2701 [Burkholderia singularis]|uniref:Uncharacterized protein n=1 Tax=Burkholderia singularis TaxID=1503053 RepID=A0A238H0Y4_9BURK|nr:hypothetical protein BSIN_2701 [Burkholderia singularis]